MAGAGRTQADGKPSGGRRVLVIGADSRLGRSVVEALREQGRVRFVAGADGADASGSPAIARLIAGTDPDTVVHLGLEPRPSRAGGRAAMKERNVIGTMQLLAAASRAPGLKRLVVKSSGAVYGCAPRDPALFAEDTPPHLPPTSGYGKDVAEAEGYVRGFARRRPDVAVSVLRFAPFAGPGVASPLLDYLTLPVVPTVLGFDPRLQFVHIDDAVRALVLATLGGHPGTYNVAGDGAMPLSQITRRLGRPTIPVLSFGAGFFGGVIRRTGIVDFTPDQVAMVRYGRVLDTARVKERLGWEPGHTTADALRAHAEGAGLKPVVPGWTKGY
ncbi:UDP-glucose 4-epimerase [Catenulispora sp. MAP12-49]|jgi:UDP-glucose 4-epimerase|uniref:NAD-dependent epimerase/dehydratase family protein n=1 Tax=unclassified Catenulispora TaxID=414885 RepID=UPI003516C6A7